MKYQAGGLAAMNDPRVRRARGMMPGPQMGLDPQMMDSGAEMMGGPPPTMKGHLQKLAQMRRMPPSHRGRNPRIGMRDQQGGLNRAMQARTGRPPISRRAAFPGSRQNMY